MFSTKKTITVNCPKCAKPMPHEKIGANYDAHGLAMFFSCFLWTPILIIAAIRDKAKPYRCSGCGSSFKGPIPEASGVPKQ